MRRFFEVDANHIAAAAMAELMKEGSVNRQVMAEALDRYEIDGAKPNPRLVRRSGTRRNRPMGMIEVKVPDIGDFSDVPVISILVAPGDTVAAEDALIELESDKATMEVPAPSAGKVASIAVKEGDTVSPRAR